MRRTRLIQAAIIVAMAAGVTGLAKAGMVVNVDWWAGTDGLNPAPIADFASDFGGGAYVNGIDAFCTTNGVADNLQDSNGVPLNDSYGNYAMRVRLPDGSSGGGGSAGISNRLWSGYRENGASAKRILFTDLAAGQAYDLVFYGYWHVDTVGDFYSQLTVGGEVKITQSGGPTVFHNVVADQDGVITVWWANPPGQGGVPGAEPALVPLNGFQVVAVPEPATLSLLVPGGFAVIGCRRRSLRCTASH